MTPELLKAIERIKALRNLAGNNSSEKEVKAAASIADKIMQEHRIDQAMLEAAGQIKTEPFKTNIAHTAGNRQVWKEFILGAACKRYGCTFYTLHSMKWNAHLHKSERELSYMVVGRESDTEIVCYLFEYLIREGLRLTSAINKGRGKGYGKSWLEGFGLGIASQLKNAEAHVIESLNNANVNAMVLLDRRAKEAKDHMESTVKLRTNPSLGGANARPDAKSKGYEVGKNVSIKKGMGGTSNSPLKLT